MSNKETEQLVASAFHHLRSKAKKGRRVSEHAIAREQFQRIQQRDNARFSIYPPGWNGEEW